MLIYYLSGGLGNQILQYAIGRGIATTRGEEMSYDASWYAMQSRKTHEIFCLGCYSLQCGHVSQRELFKISGMLIPEGRIKGPRWLYTAVIRRIYRYAQHLLGRKIWRGKNIYNIALAGLKGLPSKEKAGAGIMLHQYPFATKYFDHIARELREELTPKRIDPTIETVAKKMKGNSVCIHVRVRDEGTIPAVQYYENAIREMELRVEAPVYYVFSNHLEAAKKLLKLPETAVFIEPGDAVQDLYLMSQCSHHIIVESTYSWCGAWLGEKPNQVVVYPKGWENEAEPLKLVRDAWVAAEGMSYSDAAK